MTLQIKQLEDFYSIVGPRQAGLAMLQEHARRVFSIDKTIRGLFEGLSSLVGRLTTFHLLPYAHYVNVVFSESNLMRLLVREWRRRISLSHHFAATLRMFDGVKESMLILQASANLGSLGKVLYEGGNKSLLASSVQGQPRERKTPRNYTVNNSDRDRSLGFTPNLENTQRMEEFHLSNIFDLLPAYLQDHHHSLVLSLLHTAHSPYL
jgi:hypothetical protein